MESHPEERKPRPVLLQLASQTRGILVPAWATHCNRTLLQAGGQPEISPRFLPATPFLERHRFVGPSAHPG